MDRLLRRLLLRANAEDMTVKGLSEQVEALRAHHNVRRTLMRFAIYRRLTPEQRSALTQLRRTDNEIRSGPTRVCPLGDRLSLGVANFNGAEIQLPQLG